MSASENSAPQLTGGTPGVVVDVEGQSYSVGNGPNARFHIVVPRYFAAIRSPLAMVNETLARSRADDQRSGSR